MSQTLDWVPPSAPVEELELPGRARQMHKGEVKKASWLWMERPVILIKCNFNDLFLIGNIGNIDKNFWTLCSWQTVQMKSRQVSVLYSWSEASIHWMSRKAPKSIILCISMEAKQHLWKNHNVACKVSCKIYLPSELLVWLILLKLIFLFFIVF